MLIIGPWKQESARQGPKPTSSNMSSIAMGHSNFSPKRTREILTAWMHCRAAQICTGRSLLSSRWVQRLSIVEAGAVVHAQYTFFETPFCGNSTASSARSVRLFREHNLLLSYKRVAQFWRCIRFMRKLSTKMTPASGELHGPLPLTSTRVSLGVVKARQELPTSTVRPLRCFECLDACLLFRQHPIETNQTVNFVSSFKASACQRLLLTIETSPLVRLYSR